MPKVSSRISSIAIAIALMLPVAGAQAQKRNPEKAKIHEQRAKAARNLKQWNLTVAEYQKAYEYDPEAKYLFNIGLASDFAGKTEQAIKAFRAYLAKEPNGTYAVTARAKIKELTAALEKKKEKARAAQLAKHLQSARSYRDSGQHDAAAFEYSKAYELSKNADYLFESGESYRQAGAKERALAAYKAYLKADGAGKFAISARKHVEELEKTAGSGGPSGKPDSSLTSDTGVTKGVTKKKNKWLWVAAGAAVFLVGVAADTLPSSGSNGSFDAMDLVPVGLYGAGITAVVVGVF